MSKTEYKRLGDYIREVNVRNRDLEVTKPSGINIDKYFMPSVANVIGTDLSVYKLVTKMQFACNSMHVGRDEKIPMAMHLGDTPIIVSPAYFVFEIVEPDVLLPEYLMMWFRRPEFDRNAWFYTDADVRGGMDKNALLDMQLPIPSITRQREIVSEYETLTNRIRLNEQMNHHLEATAQALYRKTFVDNMDKENLPEGWRMGTLGEICSKIGSGATPKGGKGCYEDSGISFVRSMNVFDFNFSYDELAHISEKQAALLDNVALKEKDILLNITGASVARCCMVPNEILPARVNQHVMIIRSKVDYASYYLLFTLCADETKRSLLGISQSGSTREAITKAEIESYKIIIPPQKLMRDYANQLEIFFSNVNQRKIENMKLTELQSLLLAKMGHDNVFTEKMNYEQQPTAV